MMQKIYLNWAKPCLVSGLFMLALLFSSVNAIGWVNFLVWLQVAVYLFHESEEYVYPGGFKDFLNRTMFESHVPNVPLTDGVLFWFNIPLIWIGFPLFAILAQNVNPAYGLVLPIFGLFNATLHIIVAIVKRRYNPGLFVSVVLNYPTGIYTLWYFNKVHISNNENIIWSFLFALVCHLIIAAIGLNLLRRSRR